MTETEIGSQEPLVCLAEKQIRTVLRLLSSLPNFPPVFQA